MHDETAPPAEPGSCVPDDEFGTALDLLVERVVLDSCRDDAVSAELLDQRRVPVPADVIAGTYDIEARRADLMARFARRLPKTDD